MLIISRIVRASNDYSKLRNEEWIQGVCLDSDVYDLFKKEYQIEKGRSLKRQDLYILSFSNLELNEESFYLVIV